ncbi:MAG: hypothetical protein PVJ39_04775 [Gammaproteobacteria bacterium]|jgi:hypothetical protein
MEHTIVFIIAVLVVLSGCVSVEKYEALEEERALYAEANSSLVEEIGRLNALLDENQVFFEGHTAEGWAATALQYYKIAGFWYNKYLEAGGEPVQ